MTTPQIQTIIENFVAELTAALSEASHAAISEALGGAPTKPAVTARKGKAPKAPKKVKGAKRSAEDLAKLTQSLATYVKRNPGQRIEQIGKALGVATKELVLPAKKLIAEKRVSTKGQKRATTYLAR